MKTSFQGLEIYDFASLRAPKNFVFSCQENLLPSEKKCFEWFLFNINDFFFRRTLKIWQKLHFQNFCGISFCFVLARNPLRFQKSLNFMEKSQKNEVHQLNQNCERRLAVNAGGIKNFFLLLLRNLLILGACSRARNLLEIGRLTLSFEV